ncbi:hypothetical protein GCM10022243_68220 [Saccharothrix violaceirubra]|uniref:Ca2+-binding EF-hand superfamily protein n=1 Tax=Saccharothrix violaceirubra TaxID=413306 RepID=A0A7W7T608_9PSEU|nr:EF-hand domain-containing protein [Saccharothrix violaceirubra]MBB4967228.1 Ca2+-binding EF-hand superfamily protein [Saccharothrix violaceirubra]
MGRGFDILSRKWSLDFDALDYDGDGLLSRADMEGLVESTRVAFGPEGDPVKFAEFRSASLRWWDRFLAPADGDRDGYVTRDEYVAAYREVDLATMSAALIAFVDAIFDFVDTDADGRIGIGEFAALQRAWNASREDAMTVFESLDVDGSGHLSRGELHMYVQQYYTSPDPDALGNNLNFRF